MNYMYIFVAIIQVINGLNIHEYTSPIVTVKQGLGWMLNGHFNLVHVIDLEKYAKLIEEVKDETKLRASDSRRSIVDYYIGQAERYIRELKGKRQKRSIDWLGSAWKWLAGSPDATDWNTILRNENDLIRNNNQQYKINKRIFNVTEELIAKYNKLIMEYRTNMNERSANLIMENLIDKTLIIRAELHELVRACQMARSGVVNTNLLDDQEVNVLIGQEVSLPYQNEVEAMEYATPSLYANETILLYVVSLPKVREEALNHILVFPTISNNSQVDLPFSEVLMDEKDVYGVKKECSSIQNTAVCDPGALQKLEDGDCLVNLLKGGEAHCPTILKNQGLITLISEDTIFLSNFDGPLITKDGVKNLNGNYIIKLFNESVSIHNVTYSSITTTKVQLLPPVLSRVINNATKFDISYLQDLNVENTNELKNLQHKTYWFLATDLVTLSFIICLAIAIWRHLMKKLELPMLGPVDYVGQDNQPPEPKCSHAIDLRDAGI